MRPEVADLNALAIRRALDPAVFGPPMPLGTDSWAFNRKDQQGRVIVSVSPYPDDGDLWIHASISWRDHMPSYEDLKMLHGAVFGDRWAYQVFVPAAKHYNHHEWCLHLWGRLDGARVLPDFAPGGTV